MERLASKHKVEIVLSLLTGFGKLIFVDLLDQKFVFIICAMVFWLGYLIYHVVSKPKRIIEWGFRADNLKPLVVKTLPIFVSVSVIFLIYGLITGKAILTWHILPILMLYPLWGVVQQFLVMALVTRPLSALKSSSSKYVTALVPAVLFAIVHYPSWMLIGATFILALCYVQIYIRIPNLWVLGVYHGWLGCFYYFFVLGRNPWIEVFGKILS